jgi:hypothetical protein
MALKVIGSGFGRTGTDSMREALNILGFGPCHHMVEVMGNAEQARQWQEIAQGGTPDWERVFAGYNAAVDWPSAFFWRDLMDVYPDALVVHTHRSAESWWRSFEQTILAVVSGTGEATSMARTLVRERVFGGRPDDRAHAIAVYEAHFAEVQARVPASRLLVHSLGDGWGPLCARLGVPVPDQPYPSRNTTASFQSRLPHVFGPAATGGAA